MLSCAMRRLALLLLGTAALCVSFSRAADHSVDPITSRIERQPVESRGIAAIGYSQRLRALEVEFHRGGTYRYLGVPASLHQRLMLADSKARFYNKHVRGKYRALRVRSKARQERRR
jgi:hypothetical protein